MINFDKKELLHIAHLSALKLKEDEINLFETQIKAILAYVQQLQTVNITAQTEHVRNVNIFRDDVAVPADVAPILSQAPEIDDNYFAVPKILDEK